MSIRYLIPLIILLTLPACSQHLPPESAAAEKAVADAYRAGAARTVAEDYAEAVEQLDSGKKLLQEGKTEQARLALLEAIEKGHEAELSTYLHQLYEAEEKLELAEDYILRLEAQRNVYFEALSKHYDEQGLSEITVPQSETTYRPAKSYRVRSGENLFAIAARRKVYGDALLWPLIYKANRDQIKDPQQIYPGQVLSIPRGVSEEEKEQARATARESKIFPQSVNGKSEP